MADNMMAEWGNFFVAIAGASAGLTGLLFVGVSISLNKILAIRGLPDRALISLVLLLNTLVLALLFLVPRLGLSTLGVSAGCIALLSWYVVTRLDLNNLRHKQKEYKARYRINMAANQLAISCFIIAGIVLSLGCAAGIYWIIPATLLSIVKAVVDCWVLLVEINR